ncbi:MAG: biosynthetic arginine decarboxylase [SAR324 cluster bacterium]|nr:biosynthetic arginine decarboxylase [SAR324 cluster bacterium]
MKNMTVQEAENMYKIRSWGNDFFKINEKGNVEVLPNSDGVCIDIKELVDDIQEKGIGLPVLIRFSDILEKRIQKLYTCFDRAIQKYSYKGNYFGVYPIKVNQQRQVVEEFVKFGHPYNFGLEAGSKPELHAVLAMTDNPNALIICNGYKDKDFIQMALMGQKLDRKIILVVEKVPELENIIRVSKSLGIRPCIGLRIKLISEGAGKWESSGGEFSKFGLSAAETIFAIEMASREGMSDCVQLLHFHLGSQITDIFQIKGALKEIGRFYAELYKSGCSINYIDVGGGLGVDYDGSKSTTQASINYSVQEYANDIVQHLFRICDEGDLPHPNIISESGRALTAYHSVMVFDVLEATSLPVWDPNQTIDENDDESILQMYEILQTLDNQAMDGAWHNAQELKVQIFQKFNLGLLSLKERAKAERLFWTIARGVYRYCQEQQIFSTETLSLKKHLADKYFCNFSIFQSVPDSWAIDQLFPIMPIHRLNEFPTKEATLQDITCDSDGKIERFIGDGLRGPNSVLPVHEFSLQEPYLLGIFLVGAYQEILGDLHNLFGDTNMVHVALTEDGAWRYEQIIEGENIADVLDYVQFKADDLLQRMSHLIGISLGQGKILPHEARDLMDLYKQGLQGYTYLSRNR